MRRDLSILSMGLGRPIRHGCWIEPMRGGGGRYGIGMGDESLPELDYHLDVSDPDVAVLRRQDGTFVAAFSVRGATREGLLEAAEEDFRRSLEAHSSSMVPQEEDSRPRRSA